jgi:hypothetical protein
MKRAFAGRRKKSEDVSSEPAQSRDDLVPSAYVQQQHRYAQPKPAYRPHLPQQVEAAPSSSSSIAHATSLTSPQQPGASLGRASAKHLTHFATQVFGVGGKRNSRPGSFDQPPVPPPKSDLDPSLRHRPKTAEPDHNHRSSIIPISPGISSAVNYMRMGEEQRELEEALEKEKMRELARAREKEQESESEREKEKESEMERECERQRDRERQRLAAQEQVLKEKLAAPDPESEMAGETVEEGEKMDATDKGDMKDSWRNSTISHVTIRPGAVGSHSPRPLSMAESLQSNHTIVPVNKRQSALITDADFGMPEEDDSDKSTEEDGEEEYRHNHIMPDNDVINILSTESLKSSPTASLKSKNNRRSLSLSITSHSTFSKFDLPSAPSSATDVRTPSLPISEGMPTLPSMSPLSREKPTLSRSAATATGFISPSSSDPHSTGHNIRGRLAAWTAVGHSSSASAAQRPPAPPPLSASRHERSLPALPHHERPHPHISLQQHPLPHQFEYTQRHQNQPSLSVHPGATASPSLRQTAISMTSGFAPAAGLAKRAVEKMGRAWGGISSSSSNSNHGNSHSGYSSSSSAGTGTAPSSYSSNGHLHQHHPQGSQESAGLVLGGDLALGRTYSNQSSSGGQHTQQVKKKGRLRRTPDAPSSSSSVTTGSSVSVSDSEAFMGPSGPVLGKRLRGPLRARSGVVFGRDLKSVVRETGIGVGKPKAWGGRWKSWEEDTDVTGHDGGDLGMMTSTTREQLKVLEERKLPALVVRCAQHLLLWGIQEEGLFR